MNNREHKKLAAQLFNERRDLLAELSKLRQQNPTKYRLSVPKLNPFQMTNIQLRSQIEIIKKVMAHEMVS